MTGNWQPLLCSMVYRVPVSNISVRRVFSSNVLPAVLPTDRHKNRVCVHYIGEYLTARSISAVQTSSLHLVSESDGIGSSVNEVFHIAFFFTPTSRRATAATIRECERAAWPVFYFYDELGASGSLAFAYSYGCGLL